MIPSLKTARIWAERFWEESKSAEVNDTEAQLTFTVLRFLAMVKGDDVACKSILTTLRHSMQTTNAEAYVLELLQAVANAQQRRARGVYFTPGPVVEYLVRRAVELAPVGPLRVVDPACGGGVFLAAAARAFTGRSHVRLFGCDISAAAVAMTQSLVPVATCYQVNPLLAGEELLERLGGDSTPLIVLGNPPYSNYGRLNRGTWIEGLMAEYREGLRERKSNLGDDFIKFLRWAQYAIEQANCGLLAFITNRTYLTGITHAAMRTSLARTFSRIEIIDLHGDGEAGDENIFGIRRGVCLAIMVKRVACQSGTTVHYVSVPGSRTHKLDHLTHSPLVLNDVPRLAPESGFVPVAVKTDAQRNYDSWPRLNEIFRKYVSGVQTKCDALFVDFDHHILAARMAQACNSPSSVKWPRPPREQSQFDPTKIVPYQVGPGDFRWLYYDPQLLGRARGEVMHQLITTNGKLAEVPGEPQTGLIFMRQSYGTTGYDHAFITPCAISDRVFYSKRGAPFVAPQWLRNADGQHPNFQPQWLERMLPFSSESDVAKKSWAYLYAVLHAPWYRTEYAAALNVDFPHIPWPSSKEMFERLVACGETLLAIHLPRNHAAETLHLSGNGMIERGYPRFAHQRAYLNRESYLQTVSPLASDYRVGGYGVLDRWLRVRRGRQLSTDDIRHFSWLHTMAQRSVEIIAELPMPE